MFRQAMMQTNDKAWNFKDLDLGGVMRIMKLYKFNAINLTPDRTLYFDEDQPGLYKTHDISTLEKSTEIFDQVLLLTMERSMIESSLKRKEFLLKSMFDEIPGTASSRRSDSHCQTPSSKNLETDPIKARKPLRVRMREKRRDHDSTSPINLQVISNGYTGTSKSIILNNDQTNYLFNCGEGTQRTLQEKDHASEVTFSKTKHLFLTRKSWDTIGGLLGICISLKEASLNEITFHAPCDVVRRPSILSIFSFFMRMVLD
jgi:hypothetical protein